MKCFAPIALLAVSLAIPSAAAAQEDRPVRALLVIGGCCHDYKAQQKIITEGVSARANVEWTISYDPDKGTQHKNPVYARPDWAKGFDVVVHDECTAGVTDVPFIEQRVLQPHRDGLPAVVLHCGMHSYRSEGYPKETPWFEFTGVGSTGHGPQQPVVVSYVDKEHPISKGLADWTTINEELYNNTKVLDTAHVLARGKQTTKNRRGQERTEDFAVAWTNTYRGKTRVFATTLGHNNETVADARHLDLLTRGLLWSVDKLDEKHLKPAKKVLNEASAGAKVAPAPENLARGKVASASSFQDHDKAPSAALDGDDSTRWCAAGDSAPQWLQIDLGGPDDLTGCRITWEFDEKPYRHKLEGSGDGKVWTVLADRTNAPANQQVEDVRFDAKGVRHVRLTVTGMAEGAWASVYELEVLGTKMVTAAPQTPDQALAAATKKILKSLKAPEGFELSVFAAPPDVNYPTVLAATPTGELFAGVDEMGSLGRKPGRGRVVRCADRDGDGVADEFKTFATMDHPRGLAWDGATNTLYVLHPPLLTAYTDDNGDGVADRSEVLVTGITNEKVQGERGADHTTNGIRLAIDGWIYIAMGDFGAVKATGKDGAELQMHGGGVVRVRPDGSGLEMYTFGQRNIYDVAIDPLMNAFTRDNTNDGDGWDVRLSHIVPTANYGYPRLFKNFPDEIVKPMMELGGGSPCGALYVQEPGLPAGTGDTLFTVEWGRNAIMRHPLARKGAGFEAKEEKWMDLPRGTDMDVDAQGRFYISSWAGGGFDYSGPDVGYVVRLTPKGRTPAPVPDLNKASDEQLVMNHLASDSAVLRQAAQREILRRGKRAGVVEGLEALSRSKAPVAVRVAAVFTLERLGRAASVEEIGHKAAVAGDDDVLEAVIRAGADRKDAGHVGAALDALRSANPRLRLVAAWGLGCAGREDYADRVLPLLADPDPIVAHAAVNSLVAMGAADDCVRLIDDSYAALAPGAARVVQAFHRTDVVDMLASRLGRAKDPVVRAAAYRALCRLTYREAPWDGGWWGTRPDTSGPYYKTAEWEGTPKVKELLRGALAAEKPEMLRTLILELKRHKVDLPEAGPVVAKLAADDPAFRQMILDFLASKRALSADDVALVKPVVLSTSEAPATRAKAVRLLARRIDDDGAFEAVVQALAPVAAAEPAASDLRSALNDIVRDPRLGRRFDAFVTLTESNDAARRELGYAVLLNLATSRGERGQSRPAARKAIEASWSDAGRAVSLLRAIGGGRVEAYKQDVAARRSDPRPEVVAAATAAAQRLGLSAQPAGPTVTSLGYEKTLASATATKGDAAKGAEVFGRLACANCHTVSAAEAPKGPFLGGIGTRYNRAELCESVLKPNAKIAQGFETQWFKPAKGDVIEGFVTRESGEEVELRNVQGETLVLKKAAVERRGKRDFSTMPEGMAANLTAEELADLLAYVESLKGK